MKRIAYVVWSLLAVSGCSRNASEGNIVLQVLDFRGKQPLGLETSVKRAPGYRGAAVAVTGSAREVPNICLVEVNTPAKELGTVTTSSDCAFGDADALSNFTREEGEKIALADVNGDGTTDSITYGVTPGSRDYVEITKVNTRTDGGYILTKNDRVIYHPGETIIVHVYGWVPKREHLHVEIWNNWNGGFHYWSSATRAVNGTIDFEVQMVIPSDWPQTNESTGAAYFSYPVSELGVYNGDNFVLLDGRDGTDPEQGTTPVDGSIQIAGGAAAVSATTVSVRVAAKDAAFFRLSNVKSDLEGVPWTALVNPRGAEVPWMLAAGADGKREVFVQFAGKYGALSEIASDTVDLDATPIEIRNLAVTPTLGGTTTTYQVTFTLSEPATGGLQGSFGAVPLTGLACTNLSCSATHAVGAGDTEGAIVVAMRAADAVGWIDVEKTEVTLDLTRPQTSLTGNVPAGFQTTGTAAFGLAADESPVTYECSLDALAFTTCAATVLLTNLADGPHSYAARAIDAAGNVDATPAMTAWVVDTSAPDTVITAAPSGTTNSAGAVIGFTSPAIDVVRYECRRDGASFAACTSPVALSGLADGGHSFEVRAVDGSGNFDLTPAAATWIADTTAPDTVIAVAPSGTVYSALASIVFYSTAADLAGFECSVNAGDYAPCVSPASITSLTSGPKTFLVRARDAAGNFDSTPAAASWTVSLVPPNTTLTSGPATVTNLDSAGFTFTSDKPGTYECRIDLGSFLACNTPHTEYGLSDGNHMFQVRAVDTEGVEDPTPAITSFIVDTTPPETTITSSPAAVTRSTTAILSFGANEPGSFQCDLDGNSGLGFVACNNPSAFVGLADGVHAFSVRALDVAGNLAASPASVTWTVDTLPPLVTNLAVSSPRATTGDTITITFDVAETPANVLVTVAGRAALQTSVSGTQYTYIYVVAGDEPEGTAAVVAMADDTAGNSGIATATTVLDLTPPDTLITSAPAAFMNDLSATVDFTSAEAGATFECQIAGAGFAPCPAPYTESPLFEGLYVFDVRAVDSVGLVDPTPARATWRVDYTACAAPAAGKLSVTVQPPLTSDQLTGTAGAVESGATVKVYADATLSIPLAQIAAAADGSFPVSNIGDDVGDAQQQVYVTCIDAAGNEGLATAVRNPRLAPRVTRALVTISIALNVSGSNEYGNPNDVLRVDWDNSVDGDNNPVITSASVSIAALGLGPVSMLDAGGGKYLALFLLPTGTFDGVTGADITVVGEAGLTTGPVASQNTINVDIDPPAAPPSIEGFPLGTQVAVTWTASPAPDLAGYNLFQGYPTPTVPAGSTVAGILTTTFAAPSCSTQALGVHAIDDAGNTSDLTTGGPVSIEVDEPVFAAWGGVGAAAAKVLAADPSASVEVHFAMVTEAVGSPPWTSAYPQYSPSPITALAGINRITPLKGATDYVFTARAVKDTCTSPFSPLIPVTVLYSSYLQGGFAICPGCTWWGLPGKWYFGALGFAVAGVGDAWGNDGKEDVLTAVPGQTLALLVGSDPLGIVAYMYDYFATLDVVGGGPELANAGDVNGDGKDDFLIGSPATSSSGKIMRGMVQVVDGVTRSPLWTVFGDQTGQQLGYAVSSVGDIAGADGKAEVMVGSVGCMNFSCSDTTATASVVNIIRSNGTVLRTHTGPQVGSFFGVSVHGGVDVTGDGVPDYVVGAPGHIGNNAPAGSVHVYSGADGSEVRTIYGSAGEKFGFAVRLARANGVAGNAPRVIVGAPSRNGTAGKVYVYDIDGVLVATLDGDLPEASENFGSSLTSGGDMSGDGTDEVVVGDPNIPLSSQYGSGKAYVYSVDKAALMFEIFGDVTDGGLGYALDFLGDVNGDGVDDLVVGAPGATIDGIYNAGKIYILSIAAN